MPLCYTVGHLHLPYSTLHCYAVRHLHLSAGLLAACDALEREVTGKRTHSHIGARTHRDVHTRIQARARTLHTNTQVAHTVGHTQARALPDLHLIYSSFNADCPELHLLYTCFTPTAANAESVCTGRRRLAAEASVGRDRDGNRDGTRHRPRPSPPVNSLAAVNRQHLQLCCNSPAAALQTD